MRRTVVATDACSRVRVAQRQLHFSLTSESTPHCVPAEDVGLVILESDLATISAQALREIAKVGAAMVVCDERHLPVGVFLPFSGHSESTRIMRLQVAVSKPRMKQAWAQLVRAKIQAQLANCPAGSPVAKRMQVLVRGVRSGDPDNREAQAARAYWPILFADPTFRRRPQSLELRNTLLDYGYGVLRAAVARACVSAGLSTYLAPMHITRDDPFCLAEDLMEPVRPLIDSAVIALLGTGTSSLDRPAKAQLASVLSQSVLVGRERGPLDEALTRLATSYAQFIGGERSTLAIPRRG